MSEAGKNKKRKADQPKRRRYNNARRGFMRRLCDLERHIVKHPADTVAVEALPKVQHIAKG